MTSSPPLLRAHGLHKSFGDRSVLRGVDLEASQGTATALLGPSGSGKTTLLRCLNALDVPESGIVSIADVEVDFDRLPASGRGREAILRGLRAQSGMVFQQHHLFPHLTALQNVIEGPVTAQRRPRDEAVAEGRALLAQVGLGDREDAYPSQLSGGQQQRVGIARALAITPRVVLFDEPTSALDPEIVGEVLAVIRDLASQGWTMLIVTHEVRFAEAVADQVLFLDDGVVIERGTPAQVIGDPERERTRRFLRRVLNPGVE